MNMIIKNIYGEVNKHEVWKCECKDGVFYIDALQDYEVIHWNHPEITPTKELIEKAKAIIEQKKNKNIHFRKLLREKNMSDLISRSALKKDISAITLKIDWGEVDKVEDCVQFIETIISNCAEIIMNHIDEQPTIEAVPVVERNRIIDEYMNLLCEHCMQQKNECYNFECPFCTDGCDIIRIAAKMKGGAE